MHMQPGPHDVANLLFGKKELRLKNVRKPSHSKSTGHSSTNTTQGPVSARATAGAQQSGQCPLRKFPGAQVEHSTLAAIDCLASLWEKICS